MSYEISYLEEKHIKHSKLKHKEIKHTADAANQFNQIHTDRDIQIDLYPHYGWIDWSHIMKYSHQHQLNNDQDETDPFGEHHKTVEKKGISLHFLSNIFTKFHRKQQDETNQNQGLQYQH